MHRIGGIGKTNLVSQSYANLDIQSRHKDFKAIVKCHILPEITRELPSSPIDISSWELPSNIELADPTFYQPGQIDMLIGIDLLIGLIKLPNSKTVLQNTCLGWVVAGHPPIDHTPYAQTSNAFHACSIEEQVARFWELESCQSKKGMSVEETTCEEHFLKTYKRDSNGRFVVRLPIKPNVLTQLGNSYHTAMKRLDQLNNKFLKQPELKVAYSAFLTEYLNLGHMEQIFQTETEPSYFLPHHGVLRPDSLTTKLR
uniref:DUF1758 domain-containing protein n=1 Tax=Anopheles quadriannulatus TaxID=34691 RepID=A0A182XPL5_ANOQN